MTTNHWVEVTLPIVVVTLLAASGVSHAALPVGDRTIQFAGRSSKGAAVEAGQPEAQPDDVPEDLTAGEWCAPRQYW